MGRGLNKQEDAERNKHIGREKGTRKSDTNKEVGDMKEEVTETKKEGEDSRRETATTEEKTEIGNRQQGAPTWTLIQKTEREATRRSGHVSGGTWPHQLRATSWGGKGRHKRGEHNFIYY
ncbi:hypothetical protein NDU88_003067 [Pleurodeles waltl]|uniref:Uncharacterized protein n=1 Tax=Pleurodeles waltl TaxID=8319 RepID=A0AAV7UYY1_PLEWA|nr:hypothetical protein NDU88_003067 [Pleurodeles waltl]